MDIQLHLQFCETPQRPAVAWWFELGRSARGDAWLYEVAAWKVNQDSTRIIPFATHSHGNMSGILVVCNEVDDTSTLPLQNGVPYGAIGEKLFLPTNAKVCVPFGPDVSDTAMEEILQGSRLGESILVWHPVFGLLGAEQASIRSLNEFIQISPPQGSNWSFACPGPAINEHLFSIFPDAEVHANQVLQQVAQEIGVLSAHLDELPPAPSERGRMLPVLGRSLLVMLVLVLVVSVVAMLATFPSEQLVRVLLVLVILAVLSYFFFPAVAASIRRVGAALSRWATRWKSILNRGSATNLRGGQASTRAMHGTSASDSTWLRGFRKWVSGRAQSLSNQLSELRNREMNRLLHMLDTRPDEGLKYALPMGGNTGLHRGVAIPGFQLFQRIVDFSLSQIGGGGLVDYWSVDYEYQRRLTQKYRELANREIGLGRFRRAAYIFAELLGDLRQAAITLAQGRQYCEAAALYAERLHDTEAAALCLEQGGFYLEAAEIYEKRNEFGKVGSMYEKVGQTQLAHQAYRRAVEQRLAASDFIAAAKLLEDRLHSPDEAYETLLSGWPGSDQAALCLSTSFQLLARSGKHDRSRQQIERLAKDAESKRHLNKLLACYTDLARTYPVDDIRSQAADRTRVLVASEMERTGGSESGALLKWIQDLVPADRLLGGDCQRFRQQRFNQRTSRTKSRLLVRDLLYELEGAQWRGLFVSRDEVFASGFHHGAIASMICIARWHFSAPRFQFAPDSPGYFTNARYEFLFLTSDAWTNKLICHDLFRTTRLESIDLPATDELPARSLGRSPALDENTCGACSNILGNLFVLSRGPTDGRYHLACHRGIGNSLLWSTSIDTLAVDNAENDEIPFVDHIVTVTGQTMLPFPVPMAAGHTYCWIGHFRKLIGLTSSGFQYADECPDRIRHLVVPRQPSRDFLLACLSEGAQYWHANPLRERGKMIGNGLHKPVATFVGHRYLVLADKCRLEVYNLTTGNPALEETLEHRDGVPCGIVSVEPRAHVVLLSESGRITNYKLSPR